MRHARLQAANANQMNAGHEKLRGQISVSSMTVERLRPYRNALSDMARRKNSIKKRRQIMMNQTGRGLWQGLNTACEKCIRHQRDKKARHHVMKRHFVNEDHGRRLVGWKMPPSFCAMRDQIRGLRHLVREQCDIIPQLTDQLQERNQSLDLVEQKMSALQEQVCEFKRHLERERCKKQDLYYKTREIRKCHSTLR